MRDGKLVTSPDGDRWRVRRRWLDRGLPSAPKAYRQGVDKQTAVEIADGFMSPGTAESPTVLVLIVVVALFVVVALPLLGVALELIVVLVLLLSGAFGRLVLEEILVSIPADGPPVSLSHGERTVLPRPGF